MTSTAQRFQRRMLQVMLAIAMVLLVWGLARLHLDGITHAAAMARFAGLESVSEVAAGLIRAEPVPLLCAGMLLIAVTPALRLLLLFIDFVIQRDRLYAVICVIVGAIIALGGVLRLH